MRVFSWIGEMIREQDFFASNVTLTMAGKDTHKSIIGGAVTILVVIGVIVQSVYAYIELEQNPAYNQFPVTYDYNYSKEIEFSLRENMMAYSIRTSGDLEYSYKYLRFVF